jgi:hypothetical protein
MSDEKVEQFKEALANALISKDHEALDVLLAPWVPVQGVLDELSAQVASTVEMWELDPSEHWPDTFRLDSNSMDFETYVDSVSEFPPLTAIPPQITAENYVGWHVICLGNDDDSLDIDAWADAWLTVVEIVGGHYAGTIEFIDPD